MKISIDSVKSPAIQAEYKQAHCRHAEYLGSFQHPKRLDSQDWAIHLYEVCDALVFATNGDAIWQQYNHEAFDSLLQSYGIDLPAILIENSADEDGTLHDYQSGEAIRPATPAEIEASRNAGHEGVIEVDGRSCYVSR